MLTVRFGGSKSNQLNSSQLYVITRERHLMTFSHVLVEWDPEQLVFKHVNSICMSLAPCRLTIIKLELFISSHHDFHGPYNYVGFYLNKKKKSNGHLISHIWNHFDSLSILYFFLPTFLMYLNLILTQFRKAHFSSI